MNAAAQPKPGRNAPCYCGSGIKYKKCHRPDDQAAEEEARLFAGAGRWLRHDFMKFGREERFAESFAAALPDYWNGLYTLDNAEAMSQNEALRFFDWFVFDYQPVGGMRLIDTYAADRHDDLSGQQQAVLQSWLDAPPAGAYELLAAEGQSLRLRDFLTGEEAEVYEPGGRGAAEPGDLLLGRLVPLQARLEFSAVAAYLPQDEIGDLKEKMEAARAADAEAHPGASKAEFMRRRGHLIIHHALDQAERKGRPPVAGHDPDRPDKLARTAAQQLRRLQRGRR
ncbi:MAG: YecA family protein [Candidatus Promineifilaceae bacterium]